MYAPQSSSPQLTPFFVATLPLPPSINHQYLPVPLADVKRRQPHRPLILAPEARDWKLAATLLLAKATVKQEILDSVRRSRKPALGVLLCFYFKDLWKRDVDGGIKITLDTVFTYLGLNDNLVTDLHVTKRRADGQPSVIIEVRCLPAEGW